MSAWLPFPCWHSLSENLILDTECVHQAMPIRSPLVIHAVSFIRTGHEITQKFRDKLIPNLNEIRRVMWHYTTNSLFVDCRPQYPQIYYGQYISFFLGKFIKSLVSSNKLRVLLSVPCWKLMIMMMYLQ